MFQTLPELIIIKSYKSGYSRGRTGNPVTCKIKFFLKTVNDLRLLNIVTKHSVLHVVGVLDLPLHNGQKVFTLTPFKNVPSSPSFFPCLTLALIKPEHLYRLTTNKSIYFGDWTKKL